MSEHALTWGEKPSEDDKLWATIAHLSIFVSSFFGPLVVLLLYQDKSKYIRYHAIQALVFQGVLVIAGVVVSIISFVTCGLGSFLYLPLLLGLLLPLYGAYLGWEGKWEGLPGSASIGRE